MQRSERRMLAGAWSTGVRWMMLLVCALAGARAAQAGGPRFVTGTNMWVPSGQPMAFYTSSPAYYTDPGDLSATVSHAQADAMVAAAAAVWTVPTASLVLTQGGSLDEHVSAANTYFDGTQVVFPTDVAASNWRSKQIAVIYDTDGSVIDTLMGQGASSPTGCRQTGVVESVDSFGLNGTIQHAMIILNGRCVTTNTPQMTQMQYQLERAFGRVLGLAWAQLNDNILTGARPATAGQLANWPIMHPIDVLCGPYSYQCLSNPFQLRADDLSSLAYLYPVPQWNVGAGKTASSTNAVYLAADVYFPTGQGMDWVNVTVTRKPASTNNLEGWQIASGVTGVLYQQNIGNPVSGGESGTQNTGTPWSPAESRVVIERVPDDYVANLFMTTEPIDPLYTNEYAIGPYERPAVTPSGSPVTMVDWSARAGSGQGFSQTVSDASGTCSPGADGTQAQPAASDESGWWKGLLCGVGHSSWWSVTAKAGRSWTLEVTALDETGAPTMVKAQPVIGLWNAGDTGLPTVASAPVAMNAWSPGVTQLQVASSAAAGSYMFAVADQFGGGRPDFAYRARVLYADSVSPQVVGTGGGGLVTIAGEGFRAGNRVSVNGAAATVMSVSSTKIVARVPAMLTAGAAVGQPLTVAVTDGATGGVTAIASALSYSNIADTVAVVSAPASLETGVASAVPFAVRVLAPDGVTAASGASVMFTVAQGAASLAACGGASSCTLQADATGLVQTAVTGGGAGTVTLTATEVSGGAFQQITLTDMDPVRSVSMTNASVYVAAGGGMTAAPWTVSLKALQDGSAASGAPVTWSAGQGLTLSSTSGLTDATGTATVTVSAMPLGAGAATVTGCVWGSMCASWTVHAVDAALWRVSVTKGAGQSVAVGTALAPVTLAVTDTAGHPLRGATVAVYQTADGWEGTCAAQGRCAASPVLASAQSSGVADANGQLAVTPLQVPGLPQTVNIAAVAGTQGFVSLSLVLTP